MLILNSDVIVSLVYHKNSVIVNNIRLHCKNKIVKITNVLVSTVARYNLIGHSCYYYYNYNQLLSCFISHMEAYKI